MRFGRVVLERQAALRDRARDLAVGGDHAALSREAERHEAARVGGDGDGVELDRGEALRLVVVGLLEFCGLEERQAALADHDAVLGQPRVAVRVELLGEQHLAGADGVGRVDDDDVVLAAPAPNTSVFHELGAVGDL